MPANDDVVLATLAPAAIAPELEHLRRELRSAPDNLELATTLSQHYIALGRASADPRYYGYAQAALAPWWQKPDAPLAVLLQRAILLQNRHEFDPAIEDLERLLSRDPRQLQAWLVLATVQSVIGQPQQSLTSCRALAAHTRGLIVDACIANASRLLGHAATAYATLAASLQRHSSASLETRVWALTLQAQIADQLERESSAQFYFERALALAENDTYLLAAYSDFLLSTGQFAAARQLLRPYLSHDPLLMRLLEAERHLHDPNFGQHLEFLKTRISALSARGDTAHLELLARFALFNDDPADALRLARQNWAQQREPIDAQRLLEAALAADEPEAARPVAEWLRQTGLVYPRLQRLLEEAQG